MKLRAGLTALGWALGLAGAAASHLTPSEVTLMLAGIGCVVPLGVAYITTWGKRASKDALKEAEDALGECQDENRQLRAENRRLRVDRERSAD